MRDIKHFHQVKPETMSYISGITSFLLEKNKLVKFHKTDFSRIPRNIDNSDDVPQRRNLGRK
jgi:hypothetical protein